jgi:hypothetical protein
MFVRTNDSEKVNITSKISCWTIDFYILRGNVYSINIPQIYYNRSNTCCRIILAARSKTEEPVRRNR